MKGTYEFLKVYFFIVLLLTCFSPVNAGLDTFTNLIFVDDWLIERKFDSSTNEINCRASIPSHANWFGARVRLGSNNELIKPIWIPVNVNQVNDSKLNKIKKILDQCRSGILFLPENL